MSHNREEIVASLRGKVLAIPHTRTMFPDWPLKRHPEREKLRQIIDLDLDRSALPPEKVSKLKAADFALFACLWWPDVKYPTLEAMGRLTAWICYAWDDEIDEQSDEMAKDVEMSERYRQQAIKYSEQCLQMKGHSLTAETVHPQIALLKDILLPFAQEGIPMGFRERLHQGLESYILATSEEQQLQLSGGVFSSLAAYLGCRMRGSGLTIALAMNEYANPDSVWFPPHITCSEQMQEIWLEYNLIISICNDIASFKQELDSGSLENYISVVCVNQGKSVAEAAHQALDEVKQHMSKFEQASRTLFNRFWFDSAEWGHIPESPQLLIALQRYVHYCRTNCTGHQQWSFETKRYGLDEIPVEADGFVRVTL